MITTSHTIHLSAVTHRNEKRIKVTFDREDYLMKKIKSIPGRKWSKTKQCWHVPYDKKSFNALKEAFADCQINYQNSTPSILQPISEKKINPEIPKIKYATYRHQGQIKKKENLN